MKKSIIIIAFLLINTLVFAQISTKQLPLSISYYGHVAYQPGLKIGTTYAFKEWSTKNEKNPKLSQLTINPQIGFFSLPKTSNNLVINTEIGYRFQKLNDIHYSTFSIGVGYVAESLLTDYSTNIASGLTTSKNRELNHFFMPTINYEFARSLESKNLDWFLKTSGGTKLSTSKELNAVFFFEFGIKYYFQ